MKPHVRFKDKAEAQGPKIVYIKASLAQARRTLERYRAGQPATETAPPQAECIPSAVATTPAAVGDLLAGAYIYAMRCPAHGRDIYKVGYTDRDPEQRARELSATTSSPATFLVVQAWPVTDGQAAETAAHDALATWRISDKREFFQVTYASLRDALERAIKPWKLV
ncbi:MAG: GIY-YIG nuclease family protein [Rhodocyclaceae bacterium]|nr:GIY-YIG nuclease family protein [Rhodocyclaceae bacterium]